MAHIMKRLKQHIFILYKLQSDAILCAVLDIKHYFKIMYNTKYSNIDDPIFANILHIMNNFLKTYEFRDRVIYLVLESEQKHYLSTCPCLYCVYNVPCSICDKITPFDIFSMSTCNYRMACRGTTHKCLRCKII